MRSRFQKHKTFQKLPQANRGYVLIVTIVLLTALLFMTLKFFERTSDSLQMAGYDRGATESLLVAESAMNMLYGLYMHKADIDADGDIDIDEPIDFQNIPLHYLYYTSSGTEVDQALPSILQKIANGEARNEGGTSNNHIISLTSQRLKIENLSSGTAWPVVFEFDDQGQIKVSTRSWAELKNSNTKAAVAWLEVVKNEALLGEFQFYVQAVGKVRNSQSYVQRIAYRTRDRLGNKVPTVGQG